jgi:hypothetical protein
MPARLKNLLLGILATVWILLVVAPASSRPFPDAAKMAALRDIKDGAPGWLVSPIQGWWQQVFFSSGADRTMKKSSTTWGYEGAVRTGLSGPTVDVGNSE